MNKTTVAQIRKNDVVPVLQNALNYGEPTDNLYQAAIEEILSLRRQVIKLGGSLPMAQKPTGVDYQLLHI
jgi:hypothetical protein